MSKRDELVRIIRILDLSPKVREQALAEALTADTARVEQLLNLVLDAMRPPG